MQFWTQQSILNLIQSRNWVNKNYSSTIFAVPATDAIKIHKSIHRVNRELGGSNIPLHFIEQPDYYFENLQRVVFINRDIAEIIEPLWYSVPSGGHPQFKQDRQKATNIEEFGQLITPKLESFKASVLRQNKTKLVVEFAYFVQYEDEFLINICDFLFT